MASNQKVIYVYESFKSTTPNFLGTLFVENVRGGEAAGVHDGGKDLKLTEIQTFHRTASFCGFLNVIVESAARFVKCFHGKFGGFHRKKR